MFSFKKVSEGFVVILLTKASWEKQKGKRWTWKYYSESRQSLQSLMNFFSSPLKDSETALVPTKNAKLDATQTSPLYLQESVCSMFHCRATSWHTLCNHLWCFDLELIFKSHRCTHFLEIHNRRFRSLQLEMENSSKKTLLKLFGTSMC